MSKPAVVFVIGLPGSGKTTIAKKMADLLGFPLITTEIVRVHLLAIEKEAADIDFSPEELSQTYNVMYLITESMLRGGSGVVVDGVFRSWEQRERIFDIAKQFNTPVLGLEVTCEEPVLLERIKARKARGTRSPAGKGAYRKIASEFEPTDARFIRIDNTR